MTCSGSGYSTELCTIIQRNDTLSHPNIAEATHELCHHSLYDCPEKSFWFLVTTDTDIQHANRLLSTLNSSEAHSAVYITTIVISCAFSYLVNLGWTRCTFPIHIHIRDCSFPSFHTKHLLDIQCSTIGIMQYPTSWSASLSSIQMVCIKLFEAEYCACALQICVTVSYSGYSVASEKYQRIRYHQSKIERSCSTSVTGNLNPILAFIANSQTILFLVLHEWDTLQIRRQYHNVRVRSYIMIMLCMLQ